MGKYIKKPIEIEAIQLSKLDFSNFANNDNKFNTWIDIIKNIKMQYSVYEYNQNKYQVFICNNYSITARLDCSGFVYACLSCFLNKSLDGNSSALANLNLDEFEKINFTNFNDLKEGDIIVAPGQHAEIYAFNDGEKHKSWSVGKNGIKNISYGDSNTKYNWTTILRPTFDNSNNISKWILDAIYNNDIVIENDIIKVKSMEGIMEGKIDDYVVKGVKGELYICNKDIFEETYEKVD